MIVDINNGLQKVKGLFNLSVTVDFILKSIRKMNNSLNNKINFYNLFVVDRNLLIEKLKKWTKNNTTLNKNHLILK